MIDPRPLTRPAGRASGGPRIVRRALVLALGMLVTALVLAGPAAAAQKKKKPAPTSPIR